MTISQDDYRRLKTRLTRARNAYNKANTPGLVMTDDPRKADARRALLDAAVKLHDEAERALRIFDSEGYPDAWHAWNVAAEDAYETIHRLRNMAESD